MLFHKNQSDLALKYRKRAFQKNCAYWIEVAFFNTEKDAPMQVMKKACCEMGAGEISIFKVWTESRVPKLESGDNQILSKLQN